MGQIKFKQFYTELVEHYFRMAIRHTEVTGSSSKEWFNFTNEWLGMQSEEDKKFIRFVFDSQFLNTSEGLYCFKSDNDMYCKRTRLAALEKHFAIDSGLIAR